MAALCDRKARPEQPFGEVRIRRCLQVRPKSEFTAEKVCSTETHSAGTNATGTNASEKACLPGTNAAGTNTAGTNAAEKACLPETNAAGTNATEMNAAGTHSTGTHSAGTHSAEMNAAGTNAAERVAAERVAAERVAASCCLAAFRRRSLRTPHFALRTSHKTAARRVCRCGCQNRGGRAIGTACCTSAPLHMSQKAHERNVWLDIAAEIE